ncbi:MAG TPA: hypothetical protein VFN67_11700 [Polyangiales bacterium]|jgi:hypothetical protein|nr:hypothetical protein [Polyangiales bacterium]
MLQIFPLLAVSLALFTLFSFATGGNVQPWYETEALTIELMSGDLWHITGGHLFICFSMIMLFVEILRATRSGGASIVNHAFSVVVFVSALLLFITKRGYGNSTFFIYTAMTFLDFMAGFIITTVTARRDFAFQRVEE